MKIIQDARLLGGAAGGVARDRRGARQRREAEKPQYGGTLEVGTMFVTLSALSWDPHDWNWKLNHDTGQFYEQLFAGDLDKSKKAGGKHHLRRRRLARDRSHPRRAGREVGVVENPLRVEFKLRKGIMFPEKPGVMKKRELTAEDVVFTFNRLRSSPKKHRRPTSTSSIDVVATDKYTVVFYLKEYIAEWDYRFGWGFYSAIMPKEVADAGANNWKNVNGTGPFMLTDFVSGNSNTYTKNPDYWDKEKIGGQEYKLPFVDKLIYRTIKDEATQHAALRTGKLDMLEIDPLRSYVPELKKSAPHLQWTRWLSIRAPSWRCASTSTGRSTTCACAARSTMAINKKEIIKALLQRRGRAARLSACIPTSRLLRAAG